MMNPETAYSAAPSDTPPERFGVKDAEDASWKNYFDSLSCTECGRCRTACRYGALAADDIRRALPAIKESLDQLRELARRLDQQPESVINGPRPPKDKK